MAEDPNPSRARRRLRAELRRARDRAGLTQHDTAAAMDWSVSKLIRIETGVAGISANDLKALLGLYRIADVDETAQYLALAKASKAAPWWRGEHGNLVDPQYAQYLGFESSASELYLFHPVIVPGLVQRRGYAEAIIKAFYPSDEVEAQIALRMDRQSQVFGRPEPATVAVVVTEGALRTRVGNAGVMREQLRGLLDDAERGRAEIAVVPFTAGAHPGMNGSFTVLAFDDGDGNVLSLETAIGLRIEREDHGQVSQYIDKFEQLRAISACGDEATRLINRVIDELE